MMKHVLILLHFLCQNSIDTFRKEETSNTRETYPFYQLEVHLNRGNDLLAKDAGGELMNDNEKVFFLRYLS